ncbi:hypothetical protein D3C84_530710 [compost metagenome]
MASENRFPQSVITTLARRSANTCANPSCGAITSGPTDRPDGSINLGEAAHIYGANLGSARYDEAMLPAERRAITNAIWLCGNCHKKIDDDPNQYPPGLLFEWRQEHEQAISEKLGRTGAAIKHRYERRHLEAFGKLSYVAERLIIDKDNFWEYLLTAEALRIEVMPTARRWKALSRGLYAKPITRLERAESFDWLSDRLQEILLYVQAFMNLTNGELHLAWGAPGTPGNDFEIVSVCRLYGEVCHGVLLWEEQIRFSSVDEDFLEIRDLFLGTAGHLIDRVMEIPKFLSEMVAAEPASGTYALTLAIELPDGWVEKAEAAFAKAQSAFLADN